MKQVAVVAVPFITCTRHLMLSEQTIGSLPDKESLDLIAIVNSARKDSMDWNWINSSFSYVEENDRNNVARAWNKGISKALSRGARYVMVINLDLIFHRECVQRLVRLAQETPQCVIWSGCHIAFDDLERAPVVDDRGRPIDAACFMVDAKLFEKVGFFDEQFEPAYHEDSDMLYRIKLAGLEVASTSAARYYHIERGTVKGMALGDDKVSMEVLDSKMKINLDRYIAKWGGSPGHEVFRVPYGKA